MNICRTNPGGSNIKGKWGHANKNKRILKIKFKLTKYLILFLSRLDTEELKQQLLVNFDGIR